MTETTNCAICLHETDSPATVGGAPVCPACYGRIEAYASRVEARLARLQKRAEKISAEAEADLNRAHAMAEVIPFGQPILVGHHSEGRDRRYRDRIEKTFRRGFENARKAEQMTRRADAAGQNAERVISSDDPAAIVKLQAKIEQAEKLQATMKSVNVVIRKTAKQPEAERVAALVAAGLTEAQAYKLLLPDFMGRVGFPAYAMTNNNANIRRMTERIEDLRKQNARAIAEPTGTTETVGAVTIERDAVENRLRLLFPGKPDAATIANLKRHGFRWSPSNMAWQRQLNNGAEYAAEVILKAYTA